MAFPWRRTTKTAPLDGDIQAVWGHQGGECQLSLSGRLTMESSPGLRVLLLERLQSPTCQGVTVDFCEVAYIDTSGLAMLVEILKAARTQGKTFHLSGLRDAPRYFLETTRLLRLFQGGNADQPGINHSLPESLQ